MFKYCLKNEEYLRPFLFFYLRDAKKYQKTASFTVIDSSGNTQNFFFLYLNVVLALYAKQIIALKYVRVRKFFIYFMTPKKTHSLHFKTHITLCHVTLFRSEHSSSFLHSNFKQFAFSLLCHVNEKKKKRRSVTHHQPRRLSCLTNMQNLTHILKRWHATTIQLPNSRALA